MDRAGPAIALAASVVAVYFIPTWISSARKHHQANAIFLVNLLLGWTVIGWVAALIWSASAVRPELNREETRPCPFCAERIMKDARICKHCGRDVPAGG